MEDGMTWTRLMSIAGLVVNEFSSHEREEDEDMSEGKDDDDVERES